MENLKEYADWKYSNLDEFNAVAPQATQPSAEEERALLESCNTANVW